jgi:hypothetical protein
MIELETVSPVGKTLLLIINSRVRTTIRLVASLAHARSETIGQNTLSRGPCCRAKKGLEGKKAESTHRLLALEGIERFCSLVGDWRPRGRFKYLAVAFDEFVHRILQAQPYFHGALYRSN